MHIVSISIDKRVEEVPEVQEVLTKYGKNIVARLGLHGCEKENEGLILIVYNNFDVKDFVKSLGNIDNVNVNCMEI